jgi:4-hydroxy-tetrahydrodipicolinate synthase
MKSFPFEGTGVALVTPFDADGHVDYPALTRLIQHVTKGGVDYLVVMGTTGESATLSKDEKAAVLHHVKEVNAGQLPIVYGVGGNNTAELVHQLTHKDPSGLAGILSVTPYYNKPTQEGLYQHYKALAQVSPLPIILYNVPGRTGINMTAETTLRLARDFSNIKAVKEASGNLDQINRICKDKPVGFEVISGDDNLTYPMIALGARGVISVVGQATPKVFSDMVRLALEGRFSEALPLHNRLFDFTNQLFEQGNPGGVKAALAALGVMDNRLRLPLVPVSADLAQAIGQAAKNLQS